MIRLDLISSTNSFRVRRNDLISTQTREAEAIDEDEEEDEEDDEDDEDEEDKDAHHHNPDHHPEQEPSESPFSSLFLLLHEELRLFRVVSSPNLG